MEWVEYARLPELDTVADLEEMLRMMNSPDLTGGSVCAKWGQLDRRHSIKIIKNRSLRISEGSC